MKARREIEKIAKSLEKNNNVIFAFAYGSSSKGRMHKFSDIDIAVRLKDASLNAYFQLLSSLPETEREIDLRIIDELPPLLRLKIVREGSLLFTKDWKRLEEFISKTLIEALEIKDQIERLKRKSIGEYLADRDDN